MHVADMHLAVQDMLGRSVNYRSVKACLSAGTGRNKAQFERISYGYYRSGRKGD